jgi:hypothetical protein
VGDAAIRNLRHYAPHPRPLPASGAKENTEGLRASKICEYRGPSRGRALRPAAPQCSAAAEEIAALLRVDFASFAQACFAELYPQTQFELGWHIELIAAKLAAVRAGKIRPLIINLPPRHAKSLLASVAFPAWCLGHEPSLQILCASYAQELADKLSRDCRRIMASPWYRRVFPTRLSASRQAMAEFDTTAQGCRLATSVGGVPTGRGADLIVIDDPLKPEEALSEAQRRAANEWFDHTLYSRLNDKRRGASVLIMHRLHEDDLTGHVLEQETWDRLSLPALAETEECHSLEHFWGMSGSSGRPERHCSRSAKVPRCSGRSAIPSANTTLPANTSRPRRRWAAGSSRPPGSPAIGPTNCRRSSSASCTAGIPPTRRPSSPISASARSGASRASIFIFSTSCASASTTRN